MDPRYCEDDQGGSVFHESALADRLWPRGLTRENAAFDERVRSVAPSNGLRTWYAHSSERLTEFAGLYRGALATTDAVQEIGRLREIAASGALTFLTATREIGTSHLVMPRELLV